MAQYILEAVCTGNAPLGNGQYGHVFSGRFVLNTTTDAANNRTVINSWQFYLYVNKSDYVTSYNYGSGNKVIISINGQTVVSTTNIGRVTLGQGTAATTHYSSNPLLITQSTSAINVPHNNDGTKSLAVSANYTQTQSGNYLGTANPAGTIKLEDIQRAAPITSAPNITLAATGTTNHTVTWTDVEDYYYKLQYLYGDTVLHTSEKIDPETETYTWAVPASIAENVTNAKTMTVKAVLHTYTDSACTNEWGTSSAGFTVTFSDSFAPALSSLTVTQLSTLNGTIVAGQSKSKIEWTTAYKSNATFGSAYAVYVDGSGNELSSRVSGSSPITLGIIPAFTDTTKSIKIKVSLTDSRGFTSTATLGTAFAVYGWIAPTITALTAVRCDSGGTENLSGGYYKLTVTYSIRPLNNQNAKNAKVYYKYASDSVYTQSASGAVTDYSATLSLGPYTLSSAQDEKLDVLVAISDSLSSSNPTTMAVTILPASIFIDALTNAGGEKVGLGIGMVNDKQQTMQVGWDLEIHNGAVTVYDDNGVVRITLDFTNGMNFYNSSGTLIGSYPPTGGSGGGGNYNITSTDNGNGTQNLSITDAS